jgi:hypothetical protein
MDILHCFLVLLNFFYLSNDDEECARWHGDRHLHKMIVEHTQILCYVWHTLHPDHLVTKQLYKASKAHQKHPVTLWTLKSITHYRKIVTVTEALLSERVRRGFDKPHKTAVTLKILKDNEPEIKDNGWIDPPKCMPVEYHADEDGSPFDVIKSYRLLYAGDKVEIANLKWKPRADEPEWLDDCKSYVNSRKDIREGINTRKRKSEENKAKLRARNKRKRESISAPTVISVESIINEIKNEL